MKLLTLLTLLALCVPLGCSSKRESPSETPANVAPPLADSYWLEAVPADAVSVSEARAQAASNAKIAVRGRVGDFVASRAQFQLVDEHYEPCNSKPGDTCPTPWDYCCVPPDELARAVIVVEFREGGALARASLEGFHGFDHLADAFVVGELQKDAEDNCVLVASGLHLP